MTYMRHIIIEYGKARTIEAKLENGRTVIFAFRAAEDTADEFITAMTISEARLLAAFVYGLPRRPR